MFKLKFGSQCMLALVFGVLFGTIVTDSVLQYFTPLATVYLKLLKLTIIPLTFSSIVASFAKYEDFSTIKKLVVTTFAWFLITAVFASLIGILIGIIADIGSNLIISIPNNQLNNNMPDLTTTFLDMVPSNIIGQIAEGKIIPIIIFAIWFGLALSSIGNNTKLIGQFFNEFSLVMFKITRLIIKLSPIGIFILMAQVSNKYGISSVLPLIKFVIAIYIACFIQIFVYFLLLIFVGKINIIKFIKGFFPAMMTAFVTSSSLGTLPVTIENLTYQLKVRADIVNFVSSLGANMKMDACGAIFPAMVSIFTAHLLNIDLSIQQYIMIFFLSTIATFCTVGIPGTAIMSATFVLVGMGLPLNGLAIVLGVDRIVDMMRTMTNVIGTATCTILVDKTR